MIEAVEFWCSRPPYVDHAAPVYHALPEELRGRFMVAPGLEGMAGRLGINPHPQVDDGARGPLVFLSRNEFTLGIPTERPLVFLEHGAGASYCGRSHLPLRPEVVLLLTTAAQEAAHRAAGYGERVVVVGCPKIDSWADRHRSRRGRAQRPVVAASHHWEQATYPETRSAWPWDAEAWAQLAASGRYEILGHKHPGDERDLASWWRSLGVEFIADFAEILERADLYVADNTSTLYEFAATDRPVVCLSPPFYRREVEHGARFWSHVPGAQVSQPAELAAVIAEALEDVPARRALRRRAVASIYGDIDGKAAARAAEALVWIAGNPEVAAHRMACLPSFDQLPPVTPPAHWMQTHPSKGVPVFTVKRRVYGRAADGRTVLLYPVGATITDDEAIRVGLVAGEAKPQEQERGLVIHKERAAGSDEKAAPVRPLERMKLDELRAICDEEEIDPDGANTRAEYIAVIKDAREAAEDEAVES